MKLVAISKALCYSDNLGREEGKGRWRAESLYLQNCIVEIVTSLLRCKRIETRESFSCSVCLLWTWCMRLGNGLSDITSWWWEMLQLCTEQGVCSVLCGKFSRAAPHQGLLFFQGLSVGLTARPGWEAPLLVDSAHLLEEDRRCLPGPGSGWKGTAGGGGLCGLWTVSLLFSF